jgi:hypothetical protein
MAIDETRRYELHEAARRTLGETPGDTLMELLPPVGWADVATKHDLAELEARLKSHLDVRLHAELIHQLRWTVGSIFGAIGALGVAVGIIAAAVS